MESSSTYTFLHAMLEKGLMMMQFAEFDNCLNILQEKALISNVEHQSLLELATQLKIDTTGIAEQFRFAPKDGMLLL